MNLQISNAVKKVYGKDIENIKERVQHLLDTSSMQVIQEDEWQQEDDEEDNEDEDNNKEEVLEQKEEL